MAELRRRVPALYVSLSATTRKPRLGEVEGVNYHFVPKDRFERMRRSGEFLEWAEVHGNLYGTPMGPVREGLHKGKDVILEIDVQGALQVRKKMPEAHLVFIQAPSLDELQSRLAKRSSEDEETVARRIRVAKQEILLAPRYDYVVVNDDIARASDELAGILAEIRRSSRERQQ